MDVMAFSARDSRSKRSQKRPAASGGTNSQDREHTFEGLVRFFETVGGVPRVCRTDRMGALGVSQGRRFKLHPPAVAFAQAHGTEIRACQAKDAARKGKVEHPLQGRKGSS